MDGGGFWKISEWFLNDRRDSWVGFLLDFSHSNKHPLPNNLHTWMIRRLRTMIIQLWWSKKSITCHTHRNNSKQYIKTKYTLQSAGSMRVTPEWDSYWTFHTQKHPLHNNLHTWMIIRLRTMIIQFLCTRKNTKRQLPNKTKIKKAHTHPSFHGKLKIWVARPDEEAKEAWAQSAAFWHPLTSFLLPFGYVQWKLFFDPFLQSFWNGSWDWTSISAVTCELLMTTMAMMMIIIIIVIIIMMIIIIIIKSKTHSHQTHTRTLPELNTFGI